MGKTVALIVIVLVVLSTLSFSVVNAHSVALNYFLGTVELPLAVLLALAVSAGTFVGMAVMYARILRLRMELMQVRRSVRVAEKEVANLRTLPIKDSH